MARAPDPRIAEAKALYLKGMKLVEIASQLSLPEGTVRRWKSTHKWDSERSDKNSERSDRKKGAQPANKNAIGNRGGAAPEGNKNAVTTGEFETLFFDCLDPDELQLAKATPVDKEALLLQEIQLLTVRERRMLQRIENLRQADFTTVSIKSGIEKGQVTDLRENQATLGQIQSIEDALTRVQARKQRAIETLHRFGFDDARLELESMRLELEAAKNGDPDTGADDDGFLEALNAETDDLWSEEYDDSGANCPVKEGD